MTDGITRVRPGDLIRADDFNAILDGLEAIDARLRALEGNAGPGPDALRITNITPAAPRVGDEMRISGANFGFSTGASRVAFDNIVVTAYKIGSSDSLLIFDIPEITGLPLAGRPVLLRVSNHSSSVLRTINLQPRAEQLMGGVDLHYDGPSPSTPTAGQPFALNFRLASRANLAVTLTVTTTVSVGAWQPLLELVDAGGSALSSRRITVPSGQVRAFSVRLPIPSGTAAGTSFTVSIQAEGQGIVTTTHQPVFSVGTAAPTPATDVELALAGANPPSVLSDSTITLSPGASAEVVVLTTFEGTGTFVVSLSSPSGWTVAPDLPAGGEYEIETVDLGADGKAHRSVLIGLTAPAGGAVPATLVTTARRKGSTRSRELTLQLRTS